MLRTVFLFAICALLHGQEFRATLSGEVTDPAGAAVAGAKITAIDVDRNTSVSETSNHLGRYVIPYLAPGNYKVTVDKTGFRTLVREGIRLSSGDHPDLDLKLEVGAVNETITVTGQSSQLQTENASRSALIENRALENIPTNGRNLYQLQYTCPVWSRPAPTGARWSSTRSATSTPSPSAADAGRKRNRARRHDQYPERPRRGLRAFASTAPRSSPSRPILRRAVRTRRRRRHHDQPQVRNQRPARPALRVLQERKAARQRLDGQQERRCRRRPSRTTPSVSNSTARSTSPRCSTDAIARSS